MHLEINYKKYTMKKLLFLAAVPFLFAGCDVLNQVASTATSIIPTEGEVASGLKEALVKGVNTGTMKLNQPNAFFADAAKKILLPPEVRNIESQIRNSVILNALIGNQLDKCVKAMNEGAENAMGKAMPIFKSAVMGMTITDAMGILKGGNGSATNYLENTTTTALHTAFKPDIKNALETVGALDYWNPIVTNVNKYKSLVGLSKDINPDLGEYVTEKATLGLFSEIRVQENAIRSNPAERTSTLLKKVFDYADASK